MPCDGFLVVLYRRADLGLPRSLPVRSSVRQEAEIVRSVASVPEVGVLIARVFVGADLRISDSDTESVVNVGRALSVRLLALSKLVLRVVSVVRYSVRCDLSREIARLVVAVGRRAVGVRFGEQPVLYIVGIRALFFYL